MYGCMVSFMYVSVMIIRTLGRRSECILNMYIPSIVSVGTYIHVYIVIHPCIHRYTSTYAISYKKEFQYSMADLIVPAVSRKKL